MTLRAVREALSTARIVTITGVGGVGKTRLAYQVAAELVSSYPDGVWVCELGALREPELVPEALAATFRVQGRGGEDLIDTMGEVLAASRLLLVFDNCEHLIGEATRVIERLVSRCGGIDVLATSREGLAADGERVVPLRSLGLPEVGTDPVSAAAVRLFLSRSDAVRGGVVFGAGDLEAVATICRRLDGIPLAIELAAARTRSLSPGRHRGATRSAVRPVDRRTAHCRRTPSDAAGDPRLVLRHAFE